MAGFGWLPISVPFDIMAGLLSRVAARLVLVCCMSMILGLVVLLLMPRTFGFFVHDFSFSG
jgi:hypothetical protein